MIFILSDMTAFSSASCMEIVCLTVVWTHVILGIWADPTNFIQIRLHLAVINLGVKILEDSNNPFGNPFHWTIILMYKCIPDRIKYEVTVLRASTVFPWVRLRLVVFVLVGQTCWVWRSSCLHRLCPVMALLRASVCNCRLHLHVFTVHPQNNFPEFPENPVFYPFFLLAVEALGSHGGVGWELRRLY